MAEKNSELVQKLHETSAQLEATKKTSAEITETTDKLMTEQLEKNADLEVKLAQRTEDLEKIKRDLAEAQVFCEILILKYHTRALSPLGGARTMQFHCSYE